MTWFAALALGYVLFVAGLSLFILSDKHEYEEEEEFD